MIGYIGTVIPLIVVMVFAKPLIMLFNREKEVLEYGALFIWMISPFFLVSVSNHVYVGSMRGAGETKIPTYIMLSSFVLFRQIYLAVSCALSDSIIVVSLGYPVGWCLCSALIALYYKSGKWRKDIEVIKPSEEVNE